MDPDSCFQDLLAMILIHSPRSNPAKLVANNIRGLSDDCAYLMRKHNLENCPLAPNVSLIGGFPIQALLKGQGREPEDVCLCAIDSPVANTLGPLLRPLHIDHAPGITNSVASASKLNKECDWVQIRTLNNTQRMLTVSRILKSV